MDRWHGRRKHEVPDDNIRLIVMDREIIYEIQMRNKWLSKSYQSSVTSVSKIWKNVVILAQLGRKLLNFKFYRIQLTV